jgi:hypothetical protein
MKTNISLVIQASLKVKFKPFGKGEIKANSKFGEGPNNSAVAFVLPP